MQIFIGIMIPFVGTAAGAFCVFFLRHALHPKVQKALLGFASGVMVAASVWSLLIPAMDMSAGMGRLAFVPASVGFLLGIGFLLLGRLTKDHLPPWAEVLIGAGIITMIELAAGLLFNRKYTVWDYRGAPLNLWGQICLPFTLLWMSVSGFAMWVYTKIEPPLRKKIW